MPIDMPPYLKLSKEQKNIIDFSGNGNMLIEGPPGSGKTVVALWRGTMVAQTLDEQGGGGNDVTVLMHNKVLQKYTDSWDTTDRHENLKIASHRSWFCTKYSKECGGNAPQRSSKDSDEALTDDQLCNLDRIDLDCPYAEKDLAKARGARFDFKGNKKWYITGKTFSKDPGFWKQWSPGSAGARKSYGPLNWPQMFTDFKENNVTLGQIIIDEGQDFSPEFYDFLSHMSLLHQGNPSDCCLTICADENQRLQADENSTLREIRGRLFRSKDRAIFPLTKNYRNTRQIALLARQFYESLPTGVPELPTSSGDAAKPKATSHPNLKAQAKHIFTFMQNHPKDSALVLSATTKETVEICNELHNLCLSEEALKTIGYTYKGFLHVDSKEFNVHENGTIVCLCTGSMKGLESDHVFVVNAHSDFSGSGDYDNEYMSLYVMCSRARKRLELLYSKDARPTPRSLLQSLKNKSTIEIQTIGAPINKKGHPLKSVNATLVPGDKSLNDVRFIITGLPAYGKLFSQDGAAIQSTPYMLPFGASVISYQAPQSAFTGKDEFFL